MDQFDDYETKQALWELLGGGCTSELHAEEYWARRDSMTKWLVYYLHWEDCTFTPVALVEAQDEEEACLKALASGVRVPLGLVDVQACRFTRDLENGDSAIQVIECASCGQRKESGNDALCSFCLELFMGGGIDCARMIPK